MDYPTPKEESLKLYAVDVADRSIIIRMQDALQLTEPWGCIEQLDPRDEDSWMVTMPSSKGDTIQLKGFTLTQALGMLFSRLGGQLRYDVEEAAEEVVYKI